MIDNEIIVYQSKLSDNEIDKILTLLKIVYPNEKNFNFEYLDWLYRKNPEGKAISFNASKNGKIISHYAVIPVTYFLFNKKILGCLSLNTATHPSHLRKGLFEKLASLTYKQAYLLKNEFIFAITNKVSTPGFLKKLQFQLIGSLDVPFILQIKKLRNKENKVRKNHRPKLNFYKNWNKENLQWRLSRPNNEYTYTKTENYKLFSKTHISYIKVCIHEINLDKQLTSVIEKKVNRGNDSFISFFMKIGISKNYNNRFFNLPKKLRPSPLNLVFRDLTGENRYLKKEDVELSVLDFDAY